jgi:outer membrane protein TolC
MIKALALKVLVPAMVFAISIQLSNAQDLAEDEDTLIVNLIDYLPPLPVMIDSAIANAPRIEFFIQRQKMFEFQQEAARLEWMNRIQLNANYFDGNNNLVGNNLALGGLNYGVGISVPLGIVTTTRNAIKMAEAASLSEAAQSKEQERLIRQEVEETYSRLLMLKELIALSTEAKESARFIYEQSEIRFVKGELSLDELGQNNDLRTRWATQYTTHKTQFYDTYRLLQNLVGVPFSKFNLD